VVAGVYRVPRRRGSDRIGGAGTLKFGKKVLQAIDGICCLPTRSWLNGGRAF
jgi:hypothetical protein